MRRDSIRADELFQGLLIHCHCCQCLCYNQSTETEEQTGVASIHKLVVLVLEKITHCSFSCEDCRCYVVDYFRLFSESCGIIPSAHSHLADSGEYYDPLNLCLDVDTIFV
jgi:hypothetical protein